MLWTWATLNSNDRKIMELESKIKFFWLGGKYIKVSHVDWTLFAVVCLSKA